MIITLLAGESGSVLAIVVFYMVTQRLVLSPVHTLRRVAEQVAKGDLDVRSEIAGRDEFHGLSIAFNEMLANLQAAQEAQRRVNRSLDIKLGELAETNVALFEASRIKSDFLSNVSHELRTPLVSIIGFAELLRDAYESPNVDRKRLARYSENILTSGRSLLDIINDLLDLAKIEAGKIELHISEFSIGTLCKDLADFIQPRVDSRKQGFEIEIGDELPSFRSDSGKIKQILYNLLSNAVKFTPEGGSITLRVGRDGADWVGISVSDTGPGIPVDKRETVFEKFRQLDSSRTREYEGTGLGLAITRELVQLLGGRIELDSEVGVGSTFKVVLPAVAPQRGAGRAARAH
ncbi:MAG: HAMP domain-containing protein [Planctomycetes bacterium]|nr:HAMP domain-containing protein [Planctomycetota bacterium]